MTNLVKTTCEGQQTVTWWGWEQEKPVQATDTQQVKTQTAAQSMIAGQVQANQEVQPLLSARVEARPVKGDKGKQLAEELYQTWRSQPPHHADETLRNQLKDHLIGQPKNVRSAERSLFFWEALRVVLTILAVIAAVVTFLIIWQVIAVGLSFFLIPYFLCFACITGAACIEPKYEVATGVLCSRGYGKYITTLHSR